MKPSEALFKQIVATHRCQAPKSKYEDFEQCPRRETNGVTCGLHASSVTVTCCDAVHEVLFPAKAKHENCRGYVDGDPDKQCVCACHGRFKWQRP